MNSTSSDRDHVQRIAIIGGGISGLAAAQRLLEPRSRSNAPRPSITLFEATDRLGGILQSTRQEGFCFEHSADSFIVNDELPYAGDLCEKLDLPLIETSPENRGALILRGKQFHPVPDGLQLMSVNNLSSLLATPLLSWPGRLRAAMECFVPKRQSVVEECLHDFAVRRFGREMFDRIIQPLVAGIYTADPQKLSVAAALPQYVKQEQTHGSLRKAALAKQSRQTQQDRGARYSMFRSPTDGMQSLIDRLEETLSPSIEIRKSTPIHSICRVEDQWQIELGSRSIESFSHIVAATSAGSLAKLLSTKPRELADQLAAIEHVSTAVVCLGFKRSQVTHPLNAFGCVIPAIEKRKVLAISFTNVKFPTRAPADCVLVRAFVGGALQPEVAELDDERLMECVLADLTDMLGVSGEPLTSKIVRWPTTTPQYHLHHLARVKSIQRLMAQLPGLTIAGNAYRGVGIPQCIRSGWEAADAIRGNARG